MLVEVGLRSCEVVEGEQEFTPLFRGEDHAATSIRDKGTCVENDNRSEWANETLYSLLRHFVTKDNPRYAKLAEPKKNGEALLREIPVLARPMSAVLMSDGDRLM